MQEKKQISTFLVVVQYLFVMDIVAPFIIALLASFLARYEITATIVTMIAAVILAIAIACLIIWYTAKYFTRYLHSSYTFNVKRVITNAVITNAIIGMLNLLLIGTISFHLLGDSVYIFIGMLILCILYIVKLGFFWFITKRFFLNNKLEH